ncbi:phosphatidylinositol phosphate synthase [Dietzia sp. PP-33]|jgi:CDP-diacylglycerol--glycerol-3-phosphate 3-phosphatidyltransferase|uniref:phosphatidylinositol phosphate synthase n=1 Tax=Dietzia sp. PP-33 TaxID=2957500 RepID=UPI0029A4AA48|nr:CDP-alcohol phosphatidyltransferase family protein [Dietzia sp. PP-33]MDX2355537.1 CDP-alcohol phosphatidyltransferase family protein [Dietzia sp. PP-33]
MLSEFGRSGVTKVAHPLATFLVRMGVTANGITLTGLVLTCAAAVLLFGNGHLVAGAIVIALCTLLDLVDGAVARADDGGSPYGALVDAVSDRVADGVIFGSLVWWLVEVESENGYALLMLLACLVLSQVVSYSKARADAGGLRTPGGLMERADRLVLILLGAGLEGLGVPWALEVAATAVAVGSLITVVQRVWGGRADHLGRVARLDAPTAGER